MRRFTILSLVLGGLALAAGYANAWGGCRNGGYFGGYGGHYHGAYYGHYGHAYTNGAYYTNTDPPPASAVAADADEEEAPAGAQPARIHVIVPNNEVYLWFNGKETKSAGRDRSFITPALEPGSTYTYTLRGNLATADGDHRWEKEITVEPGQETVVQLPMDEAEMIPAVNAEAEPLDN